ncbi:hypothetical protein SDD30_03665 [Moorella naiadis]
MGLTLASAAASALALTVIYQPGSDPNRVYYGTDTRAFALLTTSLSRRSDYDIILGKSYLGTC